MHLKSNGIFSLVGSWANEKCWNPEDGAPFNESMAYRLNISEKQTESSVEQFWK